MPAKIKENEKEKKTKKTSKTATKKPTKTATKTAKVSKPAAKKNKTTKSTTTKTAKKSSVAKAPAKAKKTTSTKVTTKKAKEDVKVEKTKTKKTTTTKKATTKKTAEKKATTKKTTASKKTATSSKKTTTTKSKASAIKKTVSSVEYYDLPYSYDKTMVKVLFQTPKKLFVYWEISEADKVKLMAENGNDFFENSTPFLLVKNNTKNYSFEIQINDFANSWYFDVPDSKCEYSVELFRKNNYTHMSTPIQTSNELEVPNNHILFEQARNEIFFKNVKTNYVTSKSIVNLHFIKYAGKARPVTLNAFYNKFYNEKDLYNINNPSSF